MKIASTFWVRVHVENAIPYFKKQDTSTKIITLIKKKKKKKKTKKNL